MAEITVSAGGNTRTAQEKLNRVLVGAGEPAFLTGGAGHRLEKCLSLASCNAILGNLQGTDCPGRAWACLGSNTRDDCCRRRNGTSNSSIVYRRPVESITVLFMSVLSKLCRGLTCYQHPLQSTAIPHIMGGWML